MSGRKLRIVSDGTGNNTRVLNARGDLIPFVTKIEILPIEPNHLVRAIIHVSNVELDIDAGEQAP